VSRGDDPHVHFDRLRSADAGELPLLQEAKKFRLREHAEVADLVQEQRAAVGELDLAEPARQSAREGAFLMPEQLALDEGLRDGRAVEGDERPRRSSWLRRRS